MTIRLLRQCSHLLLLMMSILLISQTTGDAVAQDGSLNLNQASTLTGVPYDKPDVLNLGVDTNLPELGDTSQTALSPLDEKRIADQIMRQVSTSPEVVQDAEVVDYIEALGNRLARSGPDKHQSFNFFVVTDPTINAFAMPGGVIGVHTGLILAANSESELASVLGHEIGHVTQHHLARMIESQKNATFKNLAGIAIAILVARSNPQLAQGALTTSTALGIQNQLDYTRAHEREADRVGIQILKNAGFDVRGMPAFFATLQRANRFAEGTAPSFLRTHPLTSERISDVQNRVDQIPYRQSVDSLEFQYVRAKLRASGSFFDRAKTQSAIDVFHKNIAEERYANASVNHYGLAIGSLSNRDFNLVEQEINWLKENAPTHPMIENLIANYYVASQQIALAVKQYETALTKYPTNRALIYGYAELLLATQQHDNALNLIDQKQVLYTNDAYLYELKARAYTIQNKVLLSHQAQGEAYYRRYDLKRAIEQMDLAVKSNDGDFYQHSIVEARLKALKRLQADDEKG